MAGRNGSATSILVLIMQFTKNLIADDALEHPASTPCPYMVRSDAPRGFTTLRTSFAVVHAECQSAELWS